MSVRLLEEDTNLFCVKAYLCRRIAMTISDGVMTADKIAGVSGHPIETIVAASKSRFAEIDVWTLMKIVASLGYDIAIVVGDERQDDEGLIAIAEPRPSA
jgi:hypothetical protein